MKVNEIPTPFYIVYEDRLRRNLELIDHVKREAGVNIIMAFKANALWRTFPIIREYCQAATASSLNEMKLGNDELGSEIHSYCPAYTPETIKEYMAGSTHITFNSVSHWERFRDTIQAHNANGARHISPGLRVNPQCSVIETDIYNPALPGSRFGVTAEQLDGNLPEGLEGLHFHSLCESTSYDLEKVLEAFEAQFGQYLPKVKWVNMGGGHLMTRQGYDINHLISLLKAFRNRYPWIEVILEPGSAFTWRTGDLITSVVDVVENQGVKTAIVDVSFACHMPDCLEMPYQPKIIGAQIIDKEDSQFSTLNFCDKREQSSLLELPSEAKILSEAKNSQFSYRMGGNSCLSGDFIGSWQFDHELQIGERIVFEDMNHYTNVKTNMFNGITHPSIALRRLDGNIEILRTYTFEDYLHRMC